MSMVVGNGLLKDKSGQSLSYKMAVLDRSHLQQVTGLQEYVVDSLENRDLCVGRPLNILEAALGDRGLTLGTFVEEKLVAFRVLYFPGPDESNMGKFAGLPDSELDKVAHLEFEAVHPDFRGNSLQRKMGPPLMEAARRFKNWRYLCSVVSPLNYPSIIDKFDRKLMIVGLALLLDRYWRYIFFQDMLKPLKIQPESEISLPAEDWKRQAGLLGEGYSGFDLKKGRNGIEVLFGKIFQ